MNTRFVSSPSCDCAYMFKSTNASGTRKQQQKNYKRHYDTTHSTHVRLHSNHKRMRRANDVDSGCTQTQRISLQSFSHGTYFCLIGEYVFCACTHFVFFRDKLVRWRKGCHSICCSQPFNGWQNLFAGFSAQFCSKCIPINHFQNTN